MRIIGHYQRSYTVGYITTCRSPLKCRFQIKSTPPDVECVSQVQTRFVLAVSRSRNFIMKSNAPRQHFARQEFATTNSSWLLKNHPLSHRPAITTFFDTFTTAGFFPSYRTLLMIIIKDFLHVDPEFSARRDSARRASVTPIKFIALVASPFLSKYTKVFSLISLHFLSEDRGTYARKSLAHLKCPVTEIGAILKSVSNNFVMAKNATSYVIIQFDSTMNRMFLSKRTS